MPHEPVQFGAQVVRTHFPSGGVSAARALAALTPEEMPTTPAPARPKAAAEPAFANARRVMLRPMVPSSLPSCLYTDRRSFAHRNRAAECGRRGASPRDHEGNAPHSANERARTPHAQARRVRGTQEAHRGGRLVRHATGVRREAGATRGGCCAPTASPNRGAPRIRKARDACAGRASP